MIQIQDVYKRQAPRTSGHFVPKWLVAVLPLPGYSFSDGHSVFKVDVYKRQMLTLQRAVAYIVLFVLCFICLFFFYVLIVNATHNNFTIQQGFRCV